MRFFSSLAFKNAILYLFIFLIAIGILGYVLLNFSARRIIQNAENQLVFNGELVEIQLNEYINDLVNNIDFLSSSPVLEEFISDKNVTNTLRLKQEFLSLIKSYDDFSQVRILDAANGMEIVRVDKQLQKPVIVDDSLLQNKSDRIYFQEALLLGKDKMYFSPIDLNKEFGKISQPYTPTLRLSRAIFQDDELEAVLVINTNLTKLFDRLEKLVGDSYTLRMLNPDGFYVMHENVDSTFRFEFDQSHPQISNAGKLYQEGMIHYKDEIMSMHRFRVVGMEYDFVYHILASRSSLLSTYYEWRKKSIVIILIVVLLFAVIAFLLLNKQLHNLRTLTEKLKRFPHDREISKLPVNRKDEIGELAKGFEEMASILNNHIDTIELEKSKAERAEKEKSDFIENISHEIRNPLQSIMGLSSMLEQNNPRPDQQAILKSVRLNTSNLHSLVESILDYQKGIKGKLNQEFVWTNVQEFIENLAIGAKHIASQKYIEIFTDVDTCFEKMEAKLDKLRLSQILNNLISNSITNSPQYSSITIQAKVLTTGTDNISVKFAIIDTGNGMSEEELAKISDRYYTHVTSGKTQSNYGLGLTIVRELLLLVNSSIAIESEKGKGSTFSFVIEAEQRASESIRTLATELLLSKNDQVLIIEDDVQLHEFYTHLFDKQRVIYKESFKGIGELPQSVYQVVISDNRVGETRMETYMEDLINLLGEEGVIIVVSGEQIDISSYMDRLPSIQFLHKPIEKDALYNSINRGILIARFGYPAIDVIKKDYDYEPAKYLPALQLLAGEWKKYRNRLIESIEQKDEQEWEAILHKLDNTLRKLNLPKLESHLNGIMDSLKSHHTTVEKEVAFIKIVMEIYQELIEESIY